MLSFTGAWISFPGFFGPLSGEAPRGGPDRAMARRAQPLERTTLGVNAAVAAAERHATGRLLSIVWPTDQARSEEHTSELQSLMRISYAVFCLKKKNKTQLNRPQNRSHD